MKRNIAALLAGIAVLPAAPASARTAAVSPPPPAACPAPAGDRPWLNPALPPECRAQAVVDSLGSLDAKVSALMAERPGGATGPQWQVDRGLHQGGGSDGPSGIRGFHGVTAFPAPLTVAATFDPAMATRYGDIMGEEIYAAGNNTVIGPALDITRTWHFGRSVESFGEDPYLTALVIAHEIPAIQSHRVMATLKHFAGYTQEQGRSGDNPIRTGEPVNHVVSEKALREIYLPGFEAGIRAGAANVMCAFPRINGQYACESPHLLGILKQEWGFKGIVMPDFPSAQRTIVAAFNAGLDTGAMAPSPSGASSNPFQININNEFGGEDLRKAVAAGKISPARIDDLLMRRLYKPFELGVFDKPAKRVGPEVTTPARRAAAAEIVAAGTVLLKNEGGILPFGPGVKSVAIIGAQAGGRAVVTELGSAHVFPTHQQPVITAVTARAGDGVKVAYAPGTLGVERFQSVPVSLLSADGQSGLRADYFAGGNLDFAGKPFFSRVDPGLDLTATPTGIPGLPANFRWSTRWSGKFTAPETGVQKFSFYGSGSARLYLNDKLVGHFENIDFAHTLFARLPMKSGETADIRLEWTPRIVLAAQLNEIFDTSLGIGARLGWAAPDRLIEDAADAARKADVAVVFVGGRVGEGMDRETLALQNDQDALIEAVAAANPRTVVVLNTGGAITMPWLPKVAGVMQMWLPGDAQGPAAASLLFGDAQPGGRLPVTFPKDETQGPATTPAQYPGLLAPDGALDEARFDEGVLVGYRYWDARKQEPLFPFGYGLGYSTFTHEGISLRKTPEGGAEIALTVRNTGKLKSPDVVQVYLGFPASAGEPPRQLKGVGKLTLEPGQSAPMTIKLDRSAFRYWDEKAAGWKIAKGTYTVYVARSSRDILQQMPFVPRP